MVANVLGEMLCEDASNTKPGLCLSVPCLRGIAVGVVDGTVVREV